jgi:hypothetical protein
MSAEEFTYPDLDVPSPAAVRRAVRRGVLRSGFAAAAWLLVAALLVLAGGVLVGGFRGSHFGEVVYRSALVGHPGYRVIDSDCCAGLYTSRLDLRLTVRGAVSGGAAATGTIRQGLIGWITVDLPPPDGTPIGEALRRGRPAKDATAAVLDTLPKSAVASAIVEFTTPLPPAEFVTRYTADYHDVCVFLTKPYDVPTASWPVGELADFREWVGALDHGDDDLLGDLDSPPVEELRAVAADPKVTGAVLEHLSVATLRSLLADPRVTSVNIADVGFDPAQQFK